MPSLFFTADQHYDHEAIIEHCNRPFKNRNQMNHAIKKGHNDTIPEDGVVYHLGDFLWAAKNRARQLSNLIASLNGAQHHLILGNHDDMKPFGYVNQGFTSIHTSFFTEIEGINFVMNHDPAVARTLEPGTVFLCGHIHNMFKVYVPKTITGVLVINVGVDVWDFKPVSFEEIYKIALEHEDFLKGEE